MPNGSALQNLKRVPGEPEEDHKYEAAEVPDANGKDKCTQNIVWRNVVWMSLLHAGAVYSLFLIPRAHPFTWIWCKSIVRQKELNTALLAGLSNLNLVSRGFKPAPEHLLGRCRTFREGPGENSSGIIHIKM